MPTDVWDLAVIDLRSDNVFIDLDHRDSIS